MTNTALSLPFAPQAHKIDKKRFHKLRLSDLKRLRHQYDYRLITASGYLLLLLKIHGKAGWKWVINKLEFCATYGIAARSFDRAIAHLRQSKLIGQEGQGKRIALWWNQTAFDSAPQVAHSAPQVAHSAPQVAHSAPQVAQEFTESTDGIEFQPDSIFFSDNYKSLSGNEDFEFGIEEELEQQTGYEDEIEQADLQEQPESDEDTFSAPPEAPVEKIDPRETWLRSVKLPSLKYPPNDPDAWVRSQLKPGNWHRYESAYAAQQASVPQYEKAPDGLEAKIAYLRAAGTVIGTRYEGSRLIVAVDSRSLTAAEFMETSNEEFVNQKTFSISDLFKAFRSQKRTPAADAR